MTAATLTALSVAALVGVACLLVVLRWLPISVSVLVGVAIGALTFALL